MSVEMNITATEHGVVRLFAIETAQSFDHADLETALGVESLDPKQVDMIALDDLDELGLEGYLALGMGIPAEEIQAMRPQLSALKGDVALIRSAAFQGKATTLRPQSPLRWIASFGEQRLDTSSTPMTSKAAQGILTGPTPAKTRSNKTVLFWVLVAFGLMLALTLSMFFRIATS